MTVELDIERRVPLSVDLRDEEQRAATVIARGTGDVEVARDSMKLQARVRQLERVLQRQAEPEFGPFAEEDGVVTVKARGHAGQVVIAALVGMLGDARNYVQIGGWHPVAGRIKCIVQRVGKLSPHDARVLAENYLARAVALLGEHGIPWDGPTEFLPDQPVAPPVPLGGARPWLTLDIREQPNVLCCGRCGARQPMPASGTADVLNAMIAAFTEAHEGCQEGDAAALGVSRSSATNAPEGT